MFRQNFFSRTGEHSKKITTTTIILSSQLSNFSFHFIFKMLFYIASGLAVVVAILHHFWGKISAKLLDVGAIACNSDCKEYKKNLFKTLNESAKKAGPKKLKVLEIGGGTGANFEFIEESIHWTTIEPNIECQSYFTEKTQKWAEKHEFGGFIEVSKI
jgi:hypothetical protein